MSISRHQAVGAYRPWVPEDFGTTVSSSANSAATASTLSAEEISPPADRSTVSVPDGSSLGVTGRAVEPAVPSSPTEAGEKTARQAESAVDPKTEAALEPTPKSTFELPADFKLPTAEEIERMHEDIRAAAQAEGQRQGHEEGFARGFAEGERKGYEEGLAQAQAEAHQLAKLVSRLESSLRSIDHEVAEELMALAIELAREMVHDCLRDQPETILDTIRLALQQLPQTDARIELHPDDLALASTMIGDELAELGHRLQENPTLQRGDCRIEARGAQLDATLETRWRRTLASLGREHSSFHLADSAPPPRQEEEPSVTAAPELLATEPVAHQHETSTLPAEPSSRRAELSPSASSDTSAQSAEGCEP